MKFPLLARQFLEAGRRPWQNGSRRPVALLLAATLTVAATGLPIPTIKSDIGQRYPCENSTCGCRTAEQCWKSCCCHTDEEKLAWARRNGVQPPKEFMARMQAKQRAVASLHDPEESTPPGCSHCQARKAKSCCEAQAATCCETASTRSCCEAKDNLRKETRSSAVSMIPVSMIQALKCRGAAGSWLAGIVLYPPVSPVVVSFDRTLCGQTIEDEHFCPVVSYLPALPPPRVAG